MSCVLMYLVKCIETWYVKKGRKMKLEQLKNLLELLDAKGFGDEEISIDTFDEENWTITNVGWFPGQGVIILSETDC